MSGNELVPPESYDKIWLVLGIGGVAAVALWVAIVLWLTRKKSQQTLATQKTLPPKPIDIPVLKAKYIAAIAAVVAAFDTHTITEREAHLKLSELSRMFIHEVTGRPAENFTLHDLERSPFQSLATIIHAIYPPAFAEYIPGDVHATAAKITEMVTSWA